MDLSLRNQNGRLGPWIRPKRLDSHTLLSVRPTILGLPFFSRYASRMVPYFMQVHRTGASLSSTIIRCLATLH